MLPGDEQEFERLLRRRGRLTAAVGVSFVGTALLVATDALTGSWISVASTSLGFFASAATVYRLHADGFTAPSVTLHLVGEEAARDRQIRAVFVLALFGLFALMIAFEMRRLAIGS